MRRLTATFTLAAALLTPAAAHACSNAPQTDRARSAAADSIVVATVLSTRTLPLAKGSARLRKVARMRVRESFKRNPGRLIDVTFGTPQRPPGVTRESDSCDFDLFAGTTYGLFLHRRGGAWRVDGSDLDVVDAVEQAGAQLLSSASGS
jgi:hypothetical protein